MPQLPEVRTLAEQGFTEFNESFWYGVVVSSATPPNIATALQRHAQQAANQPAVQEQRRRLRQADPLGSREIHRHRARCRHESGLTHHETATEACRHLRQRH
jgi:tripartite-type tricarboxylate transporter receptor subunit TctC